MADLDSLAAAVRDARSEDLDAIETLKRQLASATAASKAEQDEVHSEQLLRCILASFLAAGADGKEVLGQVFLEILPHMAALAEISVDCTQILSDFCSLAAQACSPRDTITAFLEVLDQSLSSSEPKPAELLFLYSLMGLLPDLLARLTRRKAAFITECLAPVASLARVDGEVLQSYIIAQLKLAADAKDGTADTGPSNHTADTPGPDQFLATTWQQYEEFVRGVLHKALPGEADPAAQQSCQRAVGNLILHLLLHLTAAWPPPVLKPVIIQLLQSAAADQLPTAASVLAPAPVLSARSVQHRRPAVDSITQNPAKHQQQEQLQQAATDRVSSDAVVQNLLNLLQECGLGDWQQLAQVDGGDEAAGAALAALYLGCLQDKNCNLGSPPCGKVDMLKFVCSWCCSLAEASQGNPAILLKAIALIQLAAAQASALPVPLQHSSEALGTSYHKQPPSPQQSLHQQQHTPPAEDALTAAECARQLLPQLKCCISVLASCIASGSAVLRLQASVAMQQLLRAPGPSVSYLCLKEMLHADGEQEIHPEVAVLLMQEVRAQLAAAPPGCNSPFAGCGSVSLILPWLQQHSAAGWRNTEQLGHRANAICTALAVARLSLLKAQKHKAAATAADGMSVASHYAQLEAMLREPLTAMVKAVAAALDALQADNSQEQGQQQEPVQQQQVQQQCGELNSRSEGQRVMIPGDAAGAGQAVDAWLAVSRLQDVLDRVLELL